MNTDLFLVAGEASGDTRGAELMRALLEREPGLKFHGRGGEKMAALAEADFTDWVEEAGVIGFIDVIKKYPWFRRQFAATLDAIERLRPAAVILIDYPGFNLRLAAALKTKARAIRVIYYISPQVWAWHRSRIPKMARTIDLMLCLFPFEKELYEPSGLRTEFVGHPLVDRLQDEIGSVAREQDLVGLFPGSRRKEVAHIFPTLIAAAAVLARSHPGVRFEAAASSPKSAALMKDLLADFPGAPPVAVSTGQSRNLMQRATAGLVASGTATLEAAVLRLPHALVYKAAWLTVAIGRRLVRVPHLGIVNLLAGREVVREFLQEDATPDALAAELRRLLDQPEARKKLVSEFDQTVATLGGSGAANRAAEAILLESRP